MSSDDDDEDSNFSYIEKELLFPLIKLPILAIKEVISHFTLSKRIKISLLSKKMKRIVAFSKFDMFYTCIVKICGEDTCVEIPEELLILSCGFPSFFLNDGMTFQQFQLKPWTNEEASCLENAVSVFQNVCGICQFEELVLDINETSIRQALSILEIANWTSIQFSRLDTNHIQDRRQAKVLQTIRKEDMDMVMEKCKSELDIRVFRAFPKKYSHENAFHFFHMKYVDASWVRIENLFVLKTRGEVVLGRNNFTFFDINTLIKYWIQSPCDMFRSLTIRRPGFTELNETGMFDDISVLRTDRNSTFCYHLLTETTGRTWKILLIRRIKTNILFIARRIDDRPIEEQPIHLRSLYKMLAVLKLLNKKKQLEQEVIMINSRIVAGDNEENDLIAKKREINDEIDEISWDIRDTGARSQNGVMVF